jgi:hypothetical protein
MGKNFVQTNEADGNRVIVFQRGDNGALTELASVATGGNGDGVPHLTSQGSVVLTQDGTRLLVANAGSGDVSVLAITDEPSLVQLVPTGAAPKSLAEHAGLVYVLNTGAPSLAGFRLTNEGLEPLEGSLRELAPDADPAQVGFTPDGEPRRPVPLRDRRGRRPHLRVVGGERTALADRIVGRHPRDCRRPRSELNDNERSEGPVRCAPYGG